MNEVAVNDVNDTILFGVIYCTADEVPELHFRYVKNASSQFLIVGQCEQ